MENNTKIYLSGYGSLDLYENVPVSLTYAVADIQDISKKNSSYSKTIILPGTKTNNELLGNLFDINIDDSSFDINRKVNCFIFVNDVIVLKGYFRLLSIKKISQTSVWGDEFIEYEALVFDQTTNFYDKLGDNLLEDLDFSQYNHEYGYSSIIQTSGNTSDNVYCYPMLYNQNTTSYTTQDFHPAIYVMAYINKMFDEYQYSYEMSDELRSELEKLIIPYNGEQQKNSLDVINGRKFQVGMSSTTNSFVLSASTSPTSGPITILPFNTDNNTTIPYFDSGNTFNVATYKYTSNANQIIDFRVRIPVSLQVYNQYTSQVKLWFGGTAWNGIGSWKPQILLFKNGSSVAYSAPFYNAVLPPIIASGTTNIGAQPQMIDITFPNITANNGDVFDIRVSPQFNLPGSGNGFAWKTGTTYLGPDVSAPGFIMSFSCSTVTQTSGNNFFINQPHQTVLSDGDTIYLNEFIPKNVKQKDVFSSIVKMFNLYIEQDENNENKLIIKTRNEFYSANTALDFTDKIALDKDNQIKFLPELQNKDFILTYKQDSDNWNSYYFDQTKEVYGRKKYIFDNEYINGEKNTEIIFSPTPIEKNGFGLHVPTINSQYPKNNIRILYKPEEWLEGAWNYKYVTSAGTVITTTLSKYPYASMYDKPQYPTKSITFGNTLFEFYSDFGNLTDNNLSNRYYLNMMDQIINGKLLTAYFDLNETDILNLRFSDKIFIKDSYYYINKVIDYNAITRELTKVELIKINEGIKFNTTNRVFSRPTLIDGIYRPSGTTIGFQSASTQVVLGDTLGKGDPNLISPSSIDLGLKSNNTINTKGSIVSGEDNYISQDTKAFIIGDGNNIGGGAKGMIIGTGNTVQGGDTVIVSGYDNIIDPAAGNSIVFGNNITATTSNTIYVDNIQVYSAFTLGSETILSFTGTTLDIWSSSTGSNSIIANNYTENYVGSPFGNILGGNGNYIN